jgi:hypothetical protein
VRLQFLDRTEAGQDKSVRRKPSRIPLPQQELRGGRAVESEEMKITILGAALIVGAVIAGIALIRYLNSRNQGPEPQR